MRRKRENVEKAALGLVRASNPADEVFVLNFGDKPRIDVPFTRDLGLLERGIVRSDSIGGTAMRDAIEMGEGYLSRHATHERRVLLVVTDGKDNASVATAERIRREAEKSDTAVYAIVLLDEDDPAGSKSARQELEELAEATGGVASYPRSVDDVGGLALDLARQIRSQYTIGYSPRNQATDGSYRKRRVVAKGPDRLVVRARDGYRATPRSRGAS
jgi:VWFA-related protein